MQFTGERFVPSVAGDIRLEHLHRYYVARQMVANKRVLDIACGEGYGANLLAETAASVIGVDVNNDAILHASSTYSKHNVRFLCGGVTNIPLADSSIDVVVSFETIEHLVDHRSMMSEIKRVLTGSGILVISSPDRLQYSDIPKYSNPFHLKELYRSEFEELLLQYFKYVDLYGQRIHYSSILAPIEAKRVEITSYREGEDGLVNSGSGLPDPLYLVAAASDVATGDVSASVFIPHRPAYWDDIAILRGELTTLQGRVIDAQGIISEYDHVLKSTQLEFEDKKLEIARMKADLFWRILSPFRFLLDKLKRIIDMSR